MKSKTWALYLFLIIFNKWASCQTSENLCNLKKCLLSFSESSNRTLLQLNHDNKIYLIRQFIFTKDADTIYTGFMNFIDEDNIIVSSNGEYYSRGNLSWFMIDSVSINNDTMDVFLHNESMILNDSIEYSLFRIRHINKLAECTLVEMTPNSNYVPLILKANSMNLSEVDSSSKILSSYLIRNNFGKNIECE